MRRAIEKGEFKVEEEAAVGRGVDMATAVGPTAAKGACCSTIPLLVLLRLLLFCYCLSS